jgi:hypothetical protein
MLESGLPGSVRWVPNNNGHPYRDPSALRPEPRNCLGQTTAMI